MLRHLVEAGAIAREADGWRLTEQLGEVGLPESVREVVGRRVQRLGEPVGNVLRMAAVIGLGEAQRQAGQADPRDRGRHRRGAPADRGSPPHGEALPRGAAAAQL
jgi:hypothetical protein